MQLWARPDIIENDIEKLIYLPDGRPISAREYEHTHHNQVHGDPIYPYLVIDPLNYPLPDHVIRPFRPWRLKYFWFVQCEFYIDKQHVHPDGVDPNEVLDLDIDYTRFVKTVHEANEFALYAEAELLEYQLKFDQYIGTRVNGRSPVLYVQLTGPFPLTTSVAHRLKEVVRAGT